MANSDPRHHSIEDIAWLRAIADLTIVVPADPAETAQAVRFAHPHEGPVFIRTSRTPVPDIHAADYRFDIGRSVQLRDGSDVTIGLSTAAGTDLLVVLFSAEVHHALSSGRGWSPRRCRTYFRQLLFSQLIDADERA